MITASLHLFIDSSLFSSLTKSFFQTKVANLGFGTAPAIAVVLCADSENGLI